MSHARFKNVLQFELTAQNVKFKKKCPNQINPNFVTRQKMPEKVRTPRTVLNEQDLPVVDGWNAAYSDLLKYLSASHGELIDHIVLKIEELGVKRDHLTYIAFGLTGFYLIFGSAARLLCNFIGFGYPMYASVKAIRSHQTDDDTIWLIYWTCFAVLSLFDFFSEGILSFFPFYYIFKAIFLIYLYLPQTHGSIVFYHKVVNPLVNSIDILLGSGGNSGNSGNPAENTQAPLTAPTN
ncbi:unnamed protein product [Caenorhabditis angaria]|uniref:Receptor expression-enhancing protein n=1 Tax=Caenorhabditis angaria TaxID=860376 RepID=A0A9P1N3K0_9PELO|nr:unnamed protein product [Caenorhabditis angaria]